MKKEYDFSKGKKGRVVPTIEHFKELRKLPEYKRCWHIIDLYIELYEKHHLTTNAEEKSTICRKRP